LDVRFLTAEKIVLVVDNLNTHNGSSLYETFSPEEARQALQNEVAAWQDQRNFKQAKVDWRFSNDDARIKLKRLYPTLLT